MMPGIGCSVSEEVEKNIRNIINNQKDVHKIDDLKTRLFGSKIYIDLEISVDSNISLKKAHQIAHNVHDEVEANFIFSPSFNFLFHLSIAYNIFNYYFFLYLD